MKHLPLLPIRAPDATWAPCPGPSGVSTPPAPRASSRAAPPSLRIHPRTVEVVQRGGFLQLRDQQLLGERAEDAQHLFVALAVGIHDRPIGMMLDRSLIPQHTVVNEQRDAFLAGDLAPHGQRILHDPRRGPADLRRIPGIARHSHAVVLNEIRPDAAQERANVLFTYVPAQHRVGLVRVQVEVDAEEAVLAFDGRFAGRRGGRFGSRSGGISRD